MRRFLSGGNAKRLSSLPEFSVNSKSGLPAYEAYTSARMFGPAHMLRNVFTRLSKEIVATLNQ